MTTDKVIALLASHQDMFRRSGVTRMAIFGSRARGDEDDGSDLDVLVRMSDTAKRSGFEYFATVEGLRNQLQGIVGAPIDILVEPVRGADLARSVMADEIVALE